MPGAGREAASAAASAASALSISCRSPAGSGAVPDASIARASARSLSVSARAASIRAPASRRSLSSRAIPSSRVDACATASSAARVDTTASPRLPASSAERAAVSSSLSGVEPLARLLDIVGHRGQRGRGVPAPHALQPLLLVWQPRLHLLRPRPEGGQDLGKGSLQVAQPVERLGLGVEAFVGRAAQLQDLGQHRPHRLLVLGFSVVQPLPLRERLAQLAARVVQRLPEPGHRLLAKGCLRETELLL